MMRVALVSTEQFEVAVERDQPESVSQLAKILVTAGSRKWIFASESTTIRQPRSRMTTHPRTNWVPLNEPHEPSSFERQAGYPAPTP
jgi:hypothetical protein